MCGIVGFITNEKISRGSLVKLLNNMTDAISHRGPDDSGLWVDDKTSIALGHRRLSIIDLSQAGHQPMISNSGNFVIVFNGEIYNHLELRAELQSASSSHKWRGHSDTETLLAGFEYWGIEATLNKTVGMFALALWNVRDHILYLARDRFGEKPIYYGWVGSQSKKNFVFASELKAIRKFHNFSNLVCRQALAQYMRYMYVPAPLSIYKDIYKLEPGCLLTIRGESPKSPPSQPIHPPGSYQSLTLKRWWSLADVIKKSKQKIITDEVEALELLEKKLTNSVKLQSLADVPLGAFLSGGIDSSTIVALMQKESLKPTKTFSVGFEDKSFNEAPFARAVAKHLGTDHTEIFLTANEAQKVITELKHIYDEPFADSSQIPTRFISHIAKKQVSVSLSGDAGDELFGGYNRYFWANKVWKKLRWIPYPLRKSLGVMINNTPKNFLDYFSSSINSLLPNSKVIPQLSGKIHKFAFKLKQVRNLDDIYKSLISEWQDPTEVVRGFNGSRIIESNNFLNYPSPISEFNDFTSNPEKMMYHDSMTYLPDDILCKVDRAAMSVSLETRMPFLDHRVVELAWQLPLHMKIREGKGKWALRMLLGKYVPKELIDRPKTGFGAPLGQWLRGPLRPWAENLLSKNLLENESFFYHIPIRKKWNEHLSGRYDHSASLWAVLMFQDWLQSQ
jgi:asparagine synthase (glutamine-hydrolysing)